MTNAASSESGGADVDGCLCAPVSVTLEPRASDWVSLVRRGPLTGFQKQVREELGLPLDRPVIMSGHQAEFWHPGILAKWYAGAELARIVGGVFVWLHVDQDTNDPGVIDVPVIDATGTLVRRTLTLVEPMKDVPTSMRASRPVDPSVMRLADGERFATESVRAGVARMIEMLNRHGAPSLALQFGGSAESLAGDAQREGQTWTATSILSSTDAFARMVGLLKEDPVRAIEAHNRAAASMPEAGVRALGIKRASGAAADAGQPPRVELPLWRVRPGSPRTPVMLSQLDAIPMAELRPRALLMTGLARLGACDLFIHGTGGGVYDRVTDAWFAEWLEGSEVGNQLAPVAVATATLRLAFGASHGGVSPEEAQRAAHRAHHARHNPALLGEADAERAKRALVERIAHSVDRAERATLFREMHALLEKARAAGSPELQSLEKNAATMKRRAAEEGVASERTWPFPLYPESAIAEMRERIEREIGGSAC